LLTVKSSNCVERLTADFEHIHQWSSSNGLFVNPGISQAMVVNPRSLRLDDTQYLHLGGNRIEFYRKVKNLGLLMNDELTWDDQVSMVCRNMLFTLKRLWTMWHFTPLVTSLIMPQFLYCDVFFSKPTARLRERLKHSTHVGDTFSEFHAANTAHNTHIKLLVSRWTSITVSESAAP
jgi:hypothetical protein